MTQATHQSTEFQPPRRWPTEFQPPRRWPTRELEIRQARQTIRHREVLVWAVLASFAFTLLATLTLFYLVGMGVFSFADNVLIALSGALVGEVGVGAVMLQMVKSVFE